MPNQPAGHRHRLAAAVVALAISAGIAACGPSDTTTPDGVVRQAVTLVGSKDLDGLKALACPGQEDLLRSQLGLGSALGDQVLPNLDVQALLDAVSVDVHDVQVGQAAVDGDTAQVPVTGTVTATFDEAAVRPVIEQAFGKTLTEDQMAAALDALKAYGSDLPVDQSVRLVRQSGTWLICQESVPTPSGSLP